MSAQTTTSTVTSAQADRDVPSAERKRLLVFRATHPVRQITLAGARWEYIACGHGAETLLILPGLLGIGEMSFDHILAFEGEYRVIAPTYPFAVTTMAQLIEGIARILDAECVERAHVLGGSYGGMAAQYFVRRHPGRVSKLILSHTGGPQPERAARNRRFIGVLRLLPMGVLRAMLRLATRKSLEDAPEQRAFWEAYSEEMIGHLSKADLIARYQIAVDFDATSRFIPGDLAYWPGRILILEGDNDPVAQAAARESLKALHPQAQIHTFRGTGHVASIARLNEYISVIKQFLHEV